MKETKIAKENIEKGRIINIGIINAFNNRDILEEHKQTCQRWLLWLDKKRKEIGDWDTYEGGCSNYLLDKVDDVFELEIKDKEQAIKLYEDAGI